MESLSNIFKWTISAICFILGIWMVQPYTQLLIGAFLIAAGWIFFQSTLPKNDPIDLNELRIKSLQKQFDSFLNHYWEFGKRK